MAETNQEGRAVAKIVDNDGAIHVSREAGGVDFRTLNDMERFSVRMSRSGIGVPKHLRDNPGACFAVCVQAHAWGMEPYKVANKTYLVNDKIAYEAQVITSAILGNAPIRGRIKYDFQGEGDKRTCRAWVRLRDEDDEIVEYVSPPTGKITPKNSPLWKADPDQQLAYFSARAMARRHFPDIILGVYSPDELPQAPERAVRISEAPRGITSKLDRLAAKDAGPVIDVEPHDPETGEILDANGGDDQREPRGHSADEAAAKEIEDRKGNKAERAEHDLDAEASRALQNIDHRPEGIDVTSAKEVLAYTDGIIALHEGHGREVPDRFQEWGDQAITAWEAGYDHASDEVSGE